MQLRKREKIKKIIDVVINKDKNIIWNIDFSEEAEIYLKQPENLYQSIENYIKKFDDNHKNNSEKRDPDTYNKGKKQLVRLAKKIVKIKKLTLGEIAQKVLKF